MTWELRIKRVSNGYVLVSDEELDEGGTREVVQVVEEKTEPGDDFTGGGHGGLGNNKDAEMRSGESMLWEVVDFFSLRGSKHDKKRLRVIIEEQ